MGGFHARRSLSGKEYQETLRFHCGGEQRVAVHPDDERAVLHHEPAVLGRHLEKVKRDTITAEVLIAFCVLKNAVEFKKSAPMLFIDGGHCGDGWKIRVASSLDCNHSIQPIGFELCQGESNTSWVTFLQALKEAGIGRVKDLMIYSDCAQTIQMEV